MPRFAIPGVYTETSLDRPPEALRTGVPAFLGWLGGGEAEANVPHQVTRWARFERLAGHPAESAGAEGTHEAANFLHHAVRGFFDNGGRCCYLVRLRDPAVVMRELGLDSLRAGARAALREGLASLEAEPRLDLVCAPGLVGGPARLLARVTASMAQPPTAEAPTAEERMAAEQAAVELQREVVEHCRRMGTRFAILDALPVLDSSPGEVARLAAQAEALAGPFAALYHPWLRTSPDTALPEAVVPPCGHVAGIYARSDEAAGVQKAPANEAVEGVTDLVPPVGEAEHRRIPLVVNCLRAFPRRGVLVWGARTLAGPDDTAWTYVNVRRLFVQVARWIERTLADTAFEPNGPPLWSRVTREVSAYLGELYRAGALAGSSPGEAFTVRCDATTTPPGLVESGQVVAEIGLATHVPHEFVVVRVTHGAGGTQISGPLPG